MVTIALPKQLVLGDFGEALEAVEAHAGAAAPDEAPPLLDASEVRRVDGSGLQWLLRCLLPGENGLPAVRLQSNAVVDAALRVSGASGLIDTNAA